MSVPLSLRVCCMAVMAPALTETSTQSCIKISPSSPPSSPTLPTGGALNGNNISGIHPKSELTKPLGGFKSRITIEELKKIQQKGLLKDIGVQEIKLKLVAASEKSITTGRSLLQTVDRLETMNQLNHVNGKNGIEIPIKSDSGTKIDVASKEFDNKLVPVAKEKQDICEIQQDSAKGCDSPVEKMVASSSDSAAIVQEPNIDAQESTSLFLDLNLKEEVKKKQHALEHRTQQLMRRLRRLQSKNLESHLHSQVKDFVGFQHKNLQTVAKSIKSSSGTANEMKTELFSSDDVKSLSTAALVNLVRRFQTSQPSLTLSQRYASRSETTTKGVLTIDKPTADESACVSGVLLSNLHHMQDCFDSDATESSSGGESCDEEEATYVKKSKTTILHRRAEWKWASERASVASRWTWLQAQVSDLEYRIRQQSEIFKQIRNTKGPVLLGEQPSPEDLLWRIRQNRTGQKLSPLEQKIANIEHKNQHENIGSGSPCNISKVMMNVNRQASKLTQSLGTVSPAQSSAMAGGDNKLSASKHLNGVIGSSHGQKNITDGTNITVGPSGDYETPSSSPVNHDLTCQAARCRPVRSYRKRKLLQTVGLHTVTRKAARLSTVKCQCYPPITSCPMCGGRYNNVQRIDVDSSPVQDRVAILDPAFHPVLSFNQEIPLSIRFESHLKKGDWQNNPTGKSGKALSAEKRHQRYLAAKDKARKNGTKYTKSAAAALLSSAKLRNKYERRTPTKSRATPNKKSERRLYRTDLKKRRAAQMAAKKKRSASAHTDSYRTMTPSPMSTDSDYGLLSSSYPSCSKDSRKKKLPENAYDINNIVIPYSMAASTRVEKLQYKEIVTPKWRTVGSEDNCDSENCEEVEDVTDEAFLSRHHECELSERKRFSNFVQYPSRRSRSSRTESGTSTDIPPSVELPDIHVPGKDEAFRRRSSSAASLRRGNFSSSMDDKDFDSLESNVVEPWEERTFPLSEEDYNQLLKDQAPVEEPRKRRSSTRVSLSESFGGAETIAVEGRETVACSPLPSSSSASVASEDPDDPEWSVDLSESVKSKR